MLVGFVGKQRRSISYFALVAGTSAAVPIYAQEVVYFSDIQFVPGYSISATDIDTGQNGDDFTPDIYPNQLIRIADPINGSGDTFSTVIFDVILSDPSPQGRNFLILPLDGQANGREILSSLDSIVDVFGRPVELVVGQTYTLSFYLKPTLYRATDGGLWYINSNTGDALALTANAEDATVDLWSPVEWTEIQFNFTYEGVLDAVQWEISDNGLTLEQFDGTGGTPPLFLGSSTITALNVDFGPLVPFGVAPPIEIYPQVLTSLPVIPSMRERLGRFAWPQEPAEISVSQTTICKEKGVQFNCPTTPEQQQFFLAGQGLDVPESLNRDYWIRAGGSFDSYTNLDGTVVGAYDQSSFFLQAGKDIYQRRFDDGSVAWIDVIGHVVQAAAEAAGGGERVESLSFGLGLTGTWLSVDGYYVDAQAQINRAVSDLSSATFGTITDGHAAYVGAASLEVGKHIVMNNGWSLTPQAQFTAVRAIADGFSTNGVVVDDIDATRSDVRVGVILDKELQTEGGRTDIYGSLDVIHTLEGSSTVLVNGIALNHDRSAPVVQVGLGFDRRWDDRNMSIYGELSTAFAIDGPEEVQSVNASIGFAFEW